MKSANGMMGRLAGCVLLLSVHCAIAQDWPQFRGPNRDSHVAGFTVPNTWPKELTKKWSVKVGTGDASPVLVGDKVYVFTREGGDEIIWCLNASDGKEVWKDKYKALPVENRAASGHPGPRSSPAVADGKICTFGVSGVLSCLDAANGKVLWRKDSKVWPQFSTAASPIIVDGKCIAFLGGKGKGDLAAFDLTTGDEKWKWTGEEPAYGSPVLMTVDNTKQLVTLTKQSLVGINATDGKLLWKVGFSSRYNSVTPVVDGQMVIVSTAGPGTIAYKVEKSGDGFTAKELWKKSTASGMYNTPTLKDGLLYGLASGAGRGATNLFCMKADTGDVLWTDKTSRGECGGVLDAGSVLLLFSSDSHLVVFKPSDKEFMKIADYKIADSPTWAYPIVAGNRVYAKDKDSLILWTID